MKSEVKEMLIDFSTEEHPEIKVEIFIRCIMRGEEILKVLDSCLTGVQSFPE